ncbi:Polymerase/histidinol phosphatase-like protein [Blastocladiella britannica]|nr:Polymerase/histidinol phosphatase-like protein [Blastocladiella britannica]
MIRRTHSPLRSPTHATTLLSASAATAAATLPRPASPMLSVHEPHRPGSPAPSSRLTLVLTDAVGFHHGTSPSISSPGLSVRREDDAFTVPSSPAAARTSFRRRGTGHSTLVSAPVAAAAEAIPMESMHSSKRPVSPAAVAPMPATLDPSLPSSTELDLPPPPPARPHTPWPTTARAVVVRGVLGYVRAVLVVGLVVGVAYLATALVDGGDPPDPLVNAGGTAIDVRSQPGGVILGGNPLPGWPSSSKSVLVADLHAHTSSSSDSRVSTRTLLRVAVAAGLDVLAVTDHNTMDGARAVVTMAATDPEFQQKHIVVIPGVEYSTCRVHLTVLAADFDALTTAMSGVGTPNAWPSDPEIAATVRRARDAGAVVIAAHVPATVRSASGSRRKLVPTRQQLVEWDVDGFEVASSGGRDYDFVAAAMNSTTGTTTPPPLLMVAGSDTHAVPETWSAWTLIDVGGPEGSPPPAAPPVVTAATVIKALRARRAATLYVPDSVPMNLGPSSRQGGGFLATATAPLAMIATALSAALAPTTNSPPPPWTVHGQDCRLDNEKTSEPAAWGFVAWAAAWIAVVAAIWAFARWTARQVAKRWEYWRFAGRRGRWQKDAVVVVAV